MQYKCSKGSTLGRDPSQKSQLFSTSVVKEVHLADPSQKSQLFSTSVVKEVTLALRLESRNFQYNCSTEVRIGSSSPDVSTFQYKCSTGSTHWQLLPGSLKFSLQGSMPCQLRLESRNFSVQMQKEVDLADPARKSQLFSTSVVKEVHFGGSGSKISTLCSKGSRFGRSGSKVQYKRSKESTLRQLQLESRNLSAHV